jgi:hypothetical protein
MKRILLLATACFWLHTSLNAQTVLFQDFSSGTNPGWNLFNGASVGSYENLDNGCTQEFGIITPGVGGNNPAKILSEVITPNQQVMEVKFSIFRYNSNLTCNSRSDFACPTSVDIIVVASTYNGNDPVGDGATIYANYSGFLLPISGGFSSLNITLPPSLPAFKIFFNFTTVNCNQGGTKYVLDKFSFTGISGCAVTGTCPPVANDDYFNSTTQSFQSSTLLANVYGTNLGYTPPVLHSTHITRSLTNGVLSPLGGNDFDIDNHPLASMGFSLLSQDFTNAEATFTFNSDGTFSFTRINTSRLVFSFDYRLTDPTANFDDATVTIDFRTPSTVPVKLAWFRAVKEDDAIALNWQTETEINNRGFDVERSTDGLTFSRTGFVGSRATNGNSTSPLIYSFSDRNLPAGGTVYYRLKQTDFNGKVQYSEIRSVRLGSRTPVLTLYPNPSKGTITVQLPGDAGVADVIVSNLQGGVVQKITNSSLRKFVFTGLQTGIYTVRVINKLTGEEYSQKLMVQ